MTNDKDSKTKFIEKPVTEISGWMKELADEKATVSIWFNGEKAMDSVIVMCFSAGKELHLTLNNKDIDELMDNEEIHLIISYKGVDYLAKGPIGDIKENGNFDVILKNNVYKAEIRKSERLIAFPHHQIYAYFRFNFKEWRHDNVIPLEKYKEDNRKIYEKFNKVKSKAELKGIKSLEGFDAKDLMGFRALDLSLNGISFLANEVESEMFKDKEDNHDIVLLVNGNSYQLKKAKTVYKVDYLNPSASSISMYKIGLQFQDNDTFKDDLKDMIESFDNVEEIQRDFENFLKNK